MKIKFIKGVTSPANQAGKVNEVKDVPPYVARQLINGGYAKAIESQGEDDAVKG